AEAVTPAVADVDVVGGGLVQTQGGSSGARQSEDLFGHARGPPASAGSHQPPRESAPDPPRDQPGLRPAGAGGDHDRPGGDARDMALLVELSRRMDVTE